MASSKSAVAWLPLAAVIGGLVGAWGPYEELRAYKERHEGQKAEERERQRQHIEALEETEGNDALCKAAEQVSGGA